MSSNHALICKVFPTSLHGQTLFLLLPFPVEFCEHFLEHLGSLCKQLPMFCSPKGEHKHSIEHQVVGERVAQRLHEVVRASSAPSEIL